MIVQDLKRVEACMRSRLHETLQYAASHRQRKRVKAGGWQ